MAKEAKLITLKNLERFGQGIQDQLGIDLQALETELKAFVGNKQITYLTQAEYDVLGDADKNDENRVFIITDKVEVESATKEAFDELQSSVDTMSGTVEALQGALDAKANKTDLNAYSTTEAMNQAIQTAIADKADSSDIDAINGQIATINTALESKLEASDLEGINQSITDLTNKFDDYSTTEEVSGLITTAIANKAESSRVEEVAGNLATLTENVAKLDETFVTIESHEEQVTLINNAIAAKADAQTLADHIKAFEEHLVAAAKHVTEDDLNEAVGNIEGELAKKLEASDLTELSQKVQANEAFVASAPTTYVKIADHEQQVETINNAIAAKANQATVTTLSQTVEAHTTFITDAPTTFAAKATVDEIVETALPAKADNTRVKAIEDARLAENTVHAVAVADGKALLTENKLQKVTGLANGTELVLPAATNFMEMRVFMTAAEETSIVCSALADGLILEANCVYELRFVHVDTMIGWLVSIIEFDTIL